MKQYDLKEIDNHRVINILGIRLNNMSIEEILDHVDYCIQRKTPCHIVGLNVDQAIRVIENEYSKRIFNDAEIVFTDGVPIMWMAKRLKRKIIERVSGPDLMSRVCERAAIKHYKVFFLGAGPGVAERAAVRLEQTYPGLECVGTYSPSFDIDKNPDELKKVVKMLKESRADQLFVGMGSPKQDVFIYENMKEYGIPVSYSMGAALDFISGNLQRAPKWMRKHGLEWLYRLIQDPKRLGRRYAYDCRILVYYLRFLTQEKKEEKE